MSKGLKRICMNCGVRFYDLDKTPIICPSCQTEFTGEVAVKTRKTKAAIVKEDLAAQSANDLNETEIEDAPIDDNDDTVLLDDDEDDSDINAINDDKDVDDIDLDDEDIDDLDGDEEIKD